MSDKAQLPFGAGKIKNSTSLPTSSAAAAVAKPITTTTSSDGLASHIRLSTIFAPLIDLNASGEQTTDYDSTTLHSLQSTMSSSSSSNPVSVIAKHLRSKRLISHKQTVFEMINKMELFFVPFFLPFLFDSLFCSFLFSFFLCCLSFRVLVPHTR